MRNKLLSIFILLTVLFAFSGCQKKVEVSSIQGADKDWSIDLPSEYTKQKEEKFDDPKITTMTFTDNKNKTFVIHEMIDKETVINEETLKAELSEGSYMHVERSEVFSVEGVGKLYGAMIEDEGTGLHIMYYRVKNGDKILSFMIYQKRGVYFRRRGSGQEHTFHFEI